MTVAQTFKQAALGRPSVARIGEVSLDVSIQESHGITAEVTSHVVEDGSQQSDNHRVLPRTLSITGKVSDIPLAVDYPAQTAIGSISAAIKGDDPVQNAFQEFERYFDQHVKIDIVTGLKTYTDMYLTAFNVTRNADTGRVLAFTMTAQQVITSTTSAVAPLIIKPKKNATKKKKSSGRVNNEETSPQRQQSILAKIFS